MALTDKLTAIGDKIRFYTDIPELIPLVEMPAHVDTVYEVGHAHGYNEGYDAGYETSYEHGHTAGYNEGRQEEYDKWWDTIQDYGNRRNYANGFNVSMGGYYMFHKDVFYPKYDIICVGDASQLFYAWEKSDKYDLNLAERLEECGVILDTSQATNLRSAFNYSHIKRIPPIDVTGVTIPENTNGLFCNSWGDVHTIDKIILNENTTPYAWFTNATGLKNIIIEGKLAQSGFNVKSCTKLTRDSLLSILEALSLNITETKTITFSTAHQSIIENDTELNDYMTAAKEAGWSFVYA